MSSRRFVIAFLTVAPVAFLVPRLAHAGLEACGNIDVKAEAKCTVMTSGGCTAQCTPVSFHAACEGKATVSCDGQCTGTVDASCTGSCDTDCEAKCNVDPGNYSCSGSCQGSCATDCEATCMGQAQGSSGTGSASGDCKAQCQGNCNAKCNASCSGTPPTADCKAKCSASCSGKCQAKVTAKCQVDCQAKFDEVKCESDFMGGCTVQCTDPKGAIFCDGQYVDSGGNLSNCADALNALLNLKFDASGSASCMGNECQAQGKASVSACSTSPQESPHTPPVLPGLVVLGAVGTAIARRVRRSA